MVREVVGGGNQRGKGTALEMERAAERLSWRPCYVVGKILSATDFPDWRQNAPPLTRRLLYQLSYIGELLAQFATLIQFRHSRLSEEVNRSIH